MIDVDYATLASDVEDGTFRSRLERELVLGFRALQAAGERLPPASYYATQIAEIVHRGASEPIPSELAFDLYQEILAACENARAAVAGEKAN